MPSATTVVLALAFGCGTRTPLAVDDSDADADADADTDTDADTDADSDADTDTDVDVDVDVDADTDSDTDDPCAAPDADGDGSRRPECGGDDCDDADPAIHPGAADPPADAWSLETVDTTGRTGLYTSIAAVAGTVHLAYFDATARTVRYATSRGAGWSLETVGDPADVVFVSVAVGADTTPHVAFSADGVLFHAWREGEWSVADVADPASQNDIAVDADGIVHIAFYQGVEGSAGALGHAEGSADSFEVETADPGGRNQDTGVDPSIAIAPDGTIHVTYNWNTRGDLMRAWGTFGDWSIETVDELGRSGIRSSVALDAVGTLHVSYVAYSGPEEDLRYAFGGELGWASQTLDMRGLTGQSTSLDIDAHGRVHIAYPDWQNDELRYATEWGGEFTLETVDAAGATGWYPSLDIADGVIHVSYHDVGAGDLRYATRRVPVDEDCDGIDG